MSVVQSERVESSRSWRPVWGWVSALVVAVFAAVAATAQPTETGLRIYAVQDSFENVKDEVVDAIIKRGLVVDHTAHVGAMLARTAKDVGASKTIYADAQSILFCSATLSRRTMEADPASIAFCPYAVFVYALADAPGTTFVGYRLLPSAGSPEAKAANEAVNALLEAIVREAAGIKR